MLVICYRTLVSILVSYYCIKPIISKSTIPNYLLTPHNRGDETEIYRRATATQTENDFYKGYGVKIKPFTLKFLVL